MAITVDAGTYRFAAERSDLADAIADVADRQARERLADELGASPDGGTWRLSLAQGDIILDALSRRERTEGEA